jgi:hypothetical protein
VSHEGQVLGFNHVTSWSSTPRALSQRDRGTPSYTRLDKGPTGREVHNLPRADAQHGMHASLDEEGQMGVRTQTPIGHEYITGG